MRKETPDSCLCSVIWNWSAYYTSAVQSVINGTWTGENYYGGMQEGLVQITDLADFCVDGTKEKVDEAKAKILSGESNVFDGVMETNTGENTPDSYKVEIQTPHDTRYHYQLVADSCSTKPETHHQTSVLRRRYL